MNFFPARTVALYMARMFVLRTLSVLALLVIILQSLDLLSESSRILANEGNGQAEIWAYVGMRAPQIIQTFLPFSVLLGTIVTLATLNQNSEIIAMKASGLSAHQILAPLIACSLGVAVVSFTFNDTIVAPASAQLAQWKAVDYARIPRDSGTRTNIWVRDGNRLVNAQTVTGKGASIRLTDVTVYERVDANLRSVTRAATARFDGGTWQLTDTTFFDLATGESTKAATLTLTGTLRPDQFTLANVDPDALAFLPLRTAIADLRDAGRPTETIEPYLWHKISGPLSSVLMPLLGAVAAFGLARSGKLFVRAVAGMALGFTYFVVDNFALAMGNIGAYPPLLAAWAPFILFFLVGETVLVRTEE